MAGEPNGAPVPIGCRWDFSQLSRGVVGLTVQQGRTGLPVTVAIPMQAMAVGAAEFMLRGVGLDPQIDGSPIETPSMILTPS